MEWSVQDDWDWVSACRKLVEGCVRGWLRLQKAVQCKRSFRTLLVLPLPTSPLLPQISPLYPNVPRLPLQPAFSHHFCWLPLKALPWSACGRYKELVVSFPDSQGAASQCHTARTESCALDWHILTNASSYDGWICSARFSNRGKETWSLVEMCSFPMDPSGQLFYLIINTEPVTRNYATSEPVQHWWLGAPQSPGFLGRCFYFTFFFLIQKVSIFVVLIQQW